MKINIRSKLLLAFTLVLILTGLVGWIGTQGVSTMETSVSSMYADNLVSVQNLKDMNLQMLYYSRSLWDYILKPDQASMDPVGIQMDWYEQTMNTDLENFQKLGPTDMETSLIGDYKQAWDNYKTAAKQVMAASYGGDQAGASKLLSNSAVPKFNSAETAIKNLVDYNVKQAQDNNAASQKTYETTRLTILLFALLAVLAGLLTASFLSRAISTAARQMASVAAGISRGELEQTITVRSHDELGEMASAFNHMIAYLQSMAGAAQKIAAGDLTENIVPVSTKDALGNAFKSMAENLRDLVGQVAENAGRLAASASELTVAAGQAGLASEQIAATVQQVARGTAQQNEAVVQTAKAVEQVGMAISGVARGAQEQATAVSQVAEMTDLINSGIQQVAANARSGAQTSEQAARAAEGGAKTVNATISGMQAIQARVDLSAQKVREMGSRSEQIGLIVETIGDIAAQTNLLALNAAIEAARAGEHGKGFAVVADEVRKLAEKSAQATREITGLVKDIQATVEAAVTAMQAGSIEVERGVSQANQSGEALVQILQAAQEVRRQVIEIVNAAEQMNGLSSQLLGATDSVSAVVEENTAATEEMSAGSNDVSQAIENIASVSQENSAAIEEVSANAEEMSAQVAEVTVSAQTLAGMAAGLKQVIAQFVLPAANS